MEGFCRHGYRNGSEKNFKCPPFFSCSHTVVTSLPLKLSSSIVLHICSRYHLLCRSFCKLSQNRILEDASFRTFVQCTWFPPYISSLSTTSRPFVLFFPSNINLDALFATKTLVDDHFSGRTHRKGLTWALSLLLLVNLFGLEFAIPSRTCCGRHLPGTIQVPFNITQSLCFKSTLIAGLF